MLGERDRIRDAVGWDIGESTTPPYNNNGVQQSNWIGGIGNNTTAENIGGGITGPPQSQFNYSRDEDDEFDDATNNNFGESSADIMSNGGGIGGKEVRYAPLPLAQSPTHSNQINQAPLQRAHSR